MGGIFTELIIRTADKADVKGIAAIEQTCFSSPWNYETIEHEINESNTAHYFVAYSDGKLAGYIGVWILLDECQINKVAVLPEYRNKGVAKAILLQIIDSTRKRGTRRWMLEVRANNKAAQALYSGAGFVKVGLRKAYYDNPVDDAVLMNLEDTDA